MTASQEITRPPERISSWPLTEVRDGIRAMADEHVPYLTAREVAEAIDRGQARHMGVAPDKRLSRRR